MATRDRLNSIDLIPETSEIVRLHNATKFVQLTFCKQSLEMFTKQKKPTFSTPIIYHSCLIDFEY